MKSKYFVISILVILISIILYFMMKVENKIRQEKIIVVDSTVVRVELLPEFDIKILSAAAEKVSPDFRIKKDYFQIKKNVKGVNEWESIFLKGVNLGAALPGKFPSEFPQDFDLYMNWFIQIGEMNSNVVRVYTILPPVFYEAFANYNLIYSDKPLYLMQGVWATVPDSHDYMNEDYSYDFRKEIKDVIDVIHGNSVLEPLKGKASGTYVSDVSKYTVAFLLGREWEPRSVTYTNQNNRRKSFSGDFVCVPSGTPMETWLAEMMDYTYKYETLKYKSQHPVSFVNWLPLDPMHHNSEFIENDKVREYDNDLESIDFQKFHNTKFAKSGIYAAYHAYPYYPDYVYLDIKYRHDENNYKAYLKDLKDFCPDIPLIIAEYGVPSSRGNSHYTPYGFDQGGHNEIEQANINKILTENIHETDCGGAIMFEWIDEWFKFNWMVMDFEQPQHRRKYWHNKENPEQNFGVLAVENRTIIPDGQKNDWQEPSKFDEKNVQAHADPSYFYLKYELDDFRFDEKNLLIAIDTYDENKGEHNLAMLKKDAPTGIEFLLELSSRDSAYVLIDDEYSVFSDIYNDYVPVYRSMSNSDGRFVPQELISNRARETLLGEKFPQKIHNRSKLVCGNVDENSNADWYYSDETGILEIRLPWHLLNVSDPSSLQVLDDKPDTPDIETTEIENFKIYTYITDNKNNVLYTVPENEKSYKYIWSKWDIPEYEVRKKAQYDTLKTLFASLKPNETIYSESVTEEFEIAKWYENKKGAISVTFDDTGMGQYEFAFETLKKYHITGTFGVVGEWVAESPHTTTEDGGFGIERMGWEQIRKLHEYGNEISSHGYLHKRIDKNKKIEDIVFQLKKNKDLIESKIGDQVYTIQYPYSFADEKIYSAAERSGFMFGRIGDNSQNNCIENLLHLNSKTILNDKDPSQIEIQKIIEDNYGEWTVFMYHHIFPENSKEMHLFDYHNVYNRYSVTPRVFDNQIRLIRNSDYWIAPVSAVGKYIIERENTTVKTQNGFNSYIVELYSELNPLVYDQPLSVTFKTDWKIVKVSNSSSDGVYNVRNNEIVFSAAVNKKIIIERIK